MKNLFVLTEIVEQLLEDIPGTRNSDSYLYLKVLEHFAALQRVDLSQITVPEFFTTAGHDFPPFESVRRSRQKVQAARPDLAASEAVQAERKKRQATYKKYARG